MTRDEKIAGEVGLAIKRAIDRCHDKRDRRRARLGDTGRTVMSAAGLDRYVHLTIDKVKDEIAGELAALFARSEEI